MAISEAARSDLYTGLRDVLGPERAETLMTVVPLHDHDEVATKRDLAELRADLRAEMSEMRAEMAEMKAELKIDIASFQRTMTNWMLTLLVAIIGAMASIGFFN